MVKKLFILMGLAAGLLLVAGTGESSAAWRCGPAACVWTPGYTGYIPPYAVRWGAPHRAGCYWKLGRRGNWKYKC